MGLVGSFLRGTGRALTGTGEGIGRATRFYTRQGPAARSALIGTGIGGLYGAMSDDTSVLGGMAMGAAIGGLIPSARAGIRAFRGSRFAPGTFAPISLGSRFGTAGRAAYNDMKYRAWIGSARMGNTLNKAYGGFSAFASGVRSGFRR